MSLSKNKLEKVVVHPLVLLSTVDHFLRVNPKGGKGRVVGVLLGIPLGRRTRRPPRSDVGRTKAS